MLDEPTVGELLRDIQAEVRAMAVRQELYVTQEQRISDQKVYDLKFAALEKERAEDRARMTRLSQLVWSSIIGPVIVGVILYALLGKGP